MNKKIILVIVAVLMAIGLTACGYASVKTVYDEDSEQLDSMFMVVEKTSSWIVVYHKETKVMYAVSNGGYNAGTFTVLLNASGAPLLYEDSTKGEE